MKRYGEIEYTNEAGEPVHSDFHDKMDRDFLHKMLDEFLDQSDGFFYIGDNSRVWR